MSNYLCFDLEKDPFIKKELPPDLSGNKHDEFFFILLHFVRIVAWVEDHDYIKKNVQPRFDSAFQYALSKIKPHANRRYDMAEWMRSFEKFRSIQCQTSDPYFSHRPDLYELQFFWDLGDKRILHFMIKPIRKIDWYFLDVPLQPVDESS